MEAGDAQGLAASYFAWAPQTVDVELVRRAREVEQRWHLSCWDNLIVAAAQFQDCSLLLTEDLHDGAHFDSVIVRGPFTFNVTEPAAAPR